MADRDLSKQNTYEKQTPNISNVDAMLKSGRTRRDITLMTFNLAVVWTWRGSILRHIGVNNFNKIVIRYGDNRSV